MFNKSFWAMQQDLKHGSGIGFSIFGGQSITSKDKQSILDLNTALKNGVTPAKAWATTMTNCSIAAQNQARQCLRTKGDLLKLANGLESTTFSAKAAAVGMKALSTAMNMIAFALIAEGVKLLVKGLDALIVTQKEASEAAQKAAQQYEETKSEIESINSELETAGKRIDELNAKDNLTLVEQDELDKLTDTNLELERQLAIKEAIKKVDEKDANDKAVKALKKESEKSIRGEDYDIGGRTKTVDRITAVNQRLDALSSIEEKITALEEEQARLDGNDPRFKEIRTLLEGKGSLIGLYEARDDKNTEIAELIKNIQEDAKGLVSGLDGADELLDRIKNIENKYSIIQGTAGKTNTNILSNLLDNNQFKDIKDELISMASIGELTVEKLKQAGSVGSLSFNDISKAVEDSNLILKEGQNPLEVFIDYLKSIETEGEIASTSLETLKKEIEDLNKAIDNIQSAYQSVQSAIKEYNKEGYLSVDTLQSLMEIEPAYLRYLIDEEGNLRLGTDAMNDYTSALIDNMAQKQISKIVEYVAGLTAEERQLYLNKQAAENASEGLLDFAASTIKAKFAAGELTESELNSLTAMLNGVAEWAERAKSGIDKGGLGKTSKSAKDTSDKIAETQKKLEDLAKSEALDKLKYKFDQIEQSINKVDTALSLLDSTLNMTSDDDYIGKLETTTRQLNLAQQKSVLLRDEFVKLQAEEYNSADSANELATRMKSVTDSLAENSKSIMEYGKNITEYYMSALTSMSSVSKNVIDEATNLIERNIKSLSEGGLIGLDFALSPVVPQSAYEKQRQENRNIEQEMQAHYDAVAQMQKIALDLQYQEQLKSNAKQRQELLDTLNETKTTLQGYSNDVQAGQKSANTATSKEQKEDHAEKQAKTQSFVDNEKSIITDLNSWMTQNPIIAPSLDTSSWKKMISDAEDYAERVKKAFIGNYGEGRNALVEAARSQLGSHYKEDYAVNGSINPTQWCNDFVSWAAKQAGLDNVIPMGSYTPDTASRFGNNLISASSGYVPKVGDIAYYSSTGKRDDIYHVEIVTSINSDGTITTIGGNTGRDSIVAERVRKDLPAFYGTYAKGTKDYGIAGENYRKEYAINKKTGQWSVIDSPTLFDKKEYDIVGEKVSEKIDKPIDTFATGTIGNMDIVSEMPKLSQQQISQLLTKFKNAPSASDIYNAQNTTGVSALVILSIGALESDWGSAAIGNNLWGYGATNDNPTGNAHQYASGSAATGFAQELLGTYYSKYGLRTLNQMGSGGGNGNIAYAQTSNGVASTTWAPKISNIINGFMSSLESSGLTDFVESAETSLSAIKSNTSAIAKVDFKTELRNITEGKTSSSGAKYQDDLLAYIKENTDLQEKDIESTLSSWEALQEYNKTQKELFEGYRQKLLDSVGTNDFVSVRDAINNEAKSYTVGLIKAQTDVTVKSIKENFERAQSIQDVILKRYYERKENGANAYELNAILEAYSEQSNTVKELSDSYTSAIQQYTDYLVVIAEREIQQYQNRISWQNKINDELERQLDKTENITEAQSVIKRMTDVQKDMISVYQEQQRVAHENVLALYDNETYDPIFKQFDIESWYDAEGEGTAQFANDIATMNITASDLVPIMNELFKQIQTWKKGWYEAEDSIIACQDAIDELNKKSTDNLIDAYVKLNEETKKILENRLDKSQLNYEATSALYEFQQTLRQNKLEAQIEVRTNKDLAGWLDPETRKLLFNEDDLSEYTKGIDKINAEIEADYNDYIDKISNLKPEEMYMESEITSAWERQLEVKKEELETLKDEMNIAKKTLEYNNTAKERDTQIILGGRKVNVADPDKLYSIAQEREQLLNEASVRTYTYSNNADLRLKQSQNAVTQTEINKIQQIVDMISDMPDVAREAFAKSLPTPEGMNAWLNGIAGTATRWLNETLGTYSENILDFNRTEIGDVYNVGTNYLEIINMLPELIKRGTISQEFADYLKDLLIYARQEKASTSKDYKIYADGTHASEYGSFDQEKTKAYQSDYERLINGAKDYSGDISKSSITDKIANGEIVPVTDLPWMDNFNVDNFNVSSLDNVFSNSIMKFADVFKSNDKDNNNVTNYNIDKVDVVVKEPIENADGFVRELASGVSQNNAITKNMRR